MCVIFAVIRFKCIITNGGRCRITQQCCRSLPRGQGEIVASAVGVEIRPSVCRHHHGSTGCFIGMGQGYSLITGSDDQITGTTSSSHYSGHVINTPSYSSIVVSETGNRDDDGGGGSSLTSSSSVAAVNTSSSSSASLLEVATFPDTEK